MRKDEYILTKELRRLEKYGLLLQAKRVGYSKEGDNIYNILFTEDKRILEPECGVSEVMGIINAVETCLEIFVSKMRNNDSASITTQGVANDRKERPINALTNEGHELFEQLRALRLQVSRNEGLPPYTIFSDRALKDMCIKLPINENEMLNVYGVGQANYAKYGRVFLDRIAAYKSDNPGIVASELEYVDDNDESLPIHKDMKRSKRTKVDFYLQKEDQERFVYKDLYTLSEIRDELNRICTAVNARKIAGTKIFAYLESKGLVDEVFENGVHLKVGTPLGRDNGIRSVERISQAGNHYFVLMYPTEIQKMIVEHYTGGLS